MNREPKKIIKDIDLTCFRYVYHPQWDERKNHVYLMGTTRAFAKMSSFLEKQVAMATTFGKATREVIFRKPWEFDDAIQKSAIEGLNWNTRTLSLDFMERMKLRLDMSQRVSDVHFIRRTVEVKASKVDFDRFLTVSRFRQKDQTHGIEILHVEGVACVHCPPLGDWHGIE